MSLPLPTVASASAEAITALKSIAANSAHLRFAIAGKSYDAISFDGGEALSTPFSATLYVLADLDSAWLGQPGIVTLTDSSNHERTLAGIVARQFDRGLNAKNQSRVEIQLRPRLWVLTQTTDNRVFQGLSIPDIVTTVLKRHGIDSNSALWHLSQTYSPLPYTVQFAENDLTFIERLLSGIGVSYWFTVEDGRDIVHFTDDNAKFTQLQLGNIPFITDAGLDKPQACFNKFIKGMRSAPAKVQVVDFNPMTPDNAVKAGNGPAANDPSQVHYGLGTSGPDEAEQRARIINERHAVESLRIEITGSVAGLYPGAVFSFEHPGQSRYSGDYVVVSLSHTLTQQALVEHESDLGNLAYTQHAHLVPRTVPYRPELKPAQVLPTIYSAHIESNGTYALLDEHGRFRMRKLFDTRDTEEASHTEASIPLRSLSFHGGPGSGNTVGAAFPHRDGVEVVWASVDGDPSRPVILGTLPDPSTQSPVTSRNFGDNIMRTKGKNELLMHDIKGEEHIELKQGDYDRPFNLMRLDANSAGHLIKFATTLGAMEVYAKKTSKTEAGDSITQTHGNDRNETVENSHKLTTNKKDIHYQAATDQTHSAQDNITHKADQNIEHKSGAATQWRVSRDSIVTIKQGDQIVKIDNGSLRIQAANGISIKGKGMGGIKIGQSGAGIEIDAGGNVKLYGKAVTISGGNGVKLKGQVSYDIGAGGSLSPAALAPLTVAAIARIVSEDKSATLESDYPLMQFKGLAKYQEENEFLAWMVTVFGADIPLDAYKALRKDLSSGTLTMPPIKVLQYGMGDHPGSYDNVRREIHVSSTYLQDATKDQAKRATLFVVLNHEFGHHIDNLLRNQYSSAGGDSRGEEGSRFAYNLTNLKFDIQSQMQFASYTSAEFGAGSLIVEYAEANRIAKQYAANDQYEEHKGTTEMFGAGRGTCGNGGCYGHESIEDVLDDIKIAGVQRFNPKERLRIYFGNWMRDNSQIIDPKFVRPKGSKDLTVGFSRKTLTEVVQVMAEEKFGNDPAFKVTEERLGLYRPEEHLDNPKGVEDGRAKDPDFRCAYDAREGEIDAQGFKNYLKSYSPEPTAWKYLTGQLTQAAQLGRTVDGLRHFGQALHVYEDIFAHSNFCEISLTKLGHAVELWVPKPTSGRIPVVTGTFDGDDTQAALLLEVGESMQQAKKKFTGELSTQQKITLILIKDRYPNWAKNYRTLAEFQKDIERLTPDAVVKIYDNTYGVLNRYIDSLMGGQLMKRAETIKEIQNNNRAANSSDPTHTQISKDHPVHPLHILASDLARHSVYELGTAMAKAWENKGTLAEVIRVAELHWAHPQATTWMDTLVSQWVKANPAKIKLAASRQYLEDQALEHHAAFERRVLDTFPQYAKAAGHINAILEA